MWALDITSFVEDGSPGLIGRWDLFTAQVGLAGIANSIRATVPVQQGAFGVINEARRVRGLLGRVPIRVRVLA